MLCEFCGKSIVSIGNNRKNGKVGLSDWVNRKLHKKCYKLDQDRRFFDEYKNKIINNNF